MKEQRLEGQTKEVLAKLAGNIESNSNYLFESAGDVPERHLAKWRVEKVWSDEGASFHFYGLDYHCLYGRVSTAIQSFDSLTMRGKTTSGRIYQLIGPPGFSDDASYTMKQWLSRFKHEDGTDEFILKYRIDLTEITKQVEAERMRSFPEP